MNTTKKNGWEITTLVDWQMTEGDCLTYCYSKGFDWVESGIDLYSVLNRVSCWCCCNKNKKRTLQYLAVSSAVLGTAERITKQD